MRANQLIAKFRRAEHSPKARPRIRNGIAQRVIDMG